MLADEAATLSIEHCTGGCAERMGDARGVIVLQRF